jgi:hypothetical protein
MLALSKLKGKSLNEDKNEYDLLERRKVLGWETFGVS